MEFVKGYQKQDGTVILEGMEVKVVNIHGEIKVGVLVKPAKKEFRLDIKGESEPRVYSVELVEDLSKVDEDDENGFEE